MKTTTLNDVLTTIKDQVAATEPLFESEEATSKKDLRGEQAYEELRSRLNPRMWEVVNLLRQDIEGLWAMCDKDKKIEEKELNALALAQWLSFSDEQINYMINSTIKVLVRETVMHEQSLNAAIAMITARIKDCFKGSLITIKQKIEQDDIEVKAAAQLILVAKYLGFVKIKRKAATSTTHVAFKHSYDVLHFVLDINDDLQKYLAKRKNVEPVTFVPYTKVNFSGSVNKYNDKQPPQVSQVVARLQAVPFKLNKRMTKDYLTILKSTFKDIGEQIKLEQAYHTMGDSIYHFPASFGPDNGRIPLQGYLISGQQGGRNWATQFANERHLDEAGLRHLQAKIDSYAGKDMLKAPAKKSLEYINYLDAMDKHSKGLPVGNMLGLDGMLMGMQTHALMLRDKIQYTYCVLDDGRNHMAMALGLTKEEVKGGISPYSYGAGQKTTIKGIIEASTRDLSSVFTADFWARWESEFQKYFPATYRLRQFVKAYTKATKLEHRVDYTTWFGFNATITPLETITTVHHTVLGKREYTREAVKAGEYGSKLVAAIGHELDSSILSKLILMADYDIKPVHDEYCVHPNDGDKLVRDFTIVAKQLVAEGPEHLHAVINQMFEPYVDIYGPISVKELISNTLTTDDVVCGIN